MDAGIYISGDKWFSHGLKEFQIHAVLIQLVPSGYLTFVITF